MSAEQPRWTIAELGRKVADALATTGYEGPANGQVRAVPNERSIRYYTTLGLLDRPVEIRGRTALYGPRHLMQLVAIKRLQARGHSLAEVQAMLAGASQRKLARIADVPRAVWAGDEGGAPDSRDSRDSMDPSSDAAAGPAPAQAVPPARTRFWDEVPADAGEVPADAGLVPADAGLVPADAGLVPADAGLVPADVDMVPAAAGAPAPDFAVSSDIPQTGQAGRRTAGAPVLLASMALAPGVTLLFQPGRSPDATDAEALRRAAAQLLDELEARGLVIASQGE